MEKLEEFLYEQYDGSSFDRLPKVIRRKVDALKNIQLEHIKLQTQYNKRIQELELEFEKLHKPLYEKRAKIISGEYEPTDEECQLPANLSENEFNGDQENSNGKMEEDDDDDKPLFTAEEEKEISSKVKGIPGFWLGCLNSTFNFSESIEDHDRQVLKHLTDIQLAYANENDVLTYKLNFVFEKNQFFTNDVLTKTYYLKTKPEEKNPFNYDGFEVFKSEGCEINWIPGKDVTTHKKKQKQMNKKTGEMRSIDKDVERDSFFYFFKPPQVEGSEEPVDEEMGAIMAVDFELGELIRQSLIPRAVLYYIGLLLDDDDDDDMDSMDDDDEDDMLSDSDMDDSDEDSTDSLEKKKDK